MTPPHDARMVEVEKGGHMMDGRGELRRRPRENANTSNDLITRILPEEIIIKILSNLPPSHRFVAPVSRTLRDLYVAVVSEKRKHWTSKFSICSVPALNIYLHEAKFHRSREDEISHIGAGSGRIEWVEQGSAFDEESCRAAARGGQLIVLKWLRARGCRWNWKTCEAAAKSGHLGVLRWLRDQGCPWDEHMCDAAARAGRLEVLRWLTEQGCPAARTCEAAAWGGHLHVLQWLRDRGYHWDANTCYWAAWDGHLEVLRWAIQNGCPYSESDFRRIKDPAFHKWFEEYKNTPARDEH